MPIPITTELVGYATTTLLVDNTAGGDIPVQMPSGIQAGDELVAFIMNSSANVVDINGPSRWIGILSTGQFFKTADGSEDGVVLHWTTQDTRGVFEAPATNRDVVATVVAYRFSVPHVSRFTFYQHLAATGGTGTLSHIPQTGLVGNTALRVYGMVGYGTNSDLSGAPASSIDWTNPTDRTGLHVQGDTALSVADAFYDFPPPFAVYNPNDAVTVNVSAEFTGGDLYTVVYNYPYDCDNNTGGGLFVGSATTSTIITEGVGTVPINMPASVQAGDYLVMFMGNINANEVDPGTARNPPGWNHVWGQTSDYEWYKVADGTEGGTTVDFPINMVFGGGPHDRSWVAAVLQYRFNQAPSVVASVGTNRNFIQSTTNYPSSAAVSGHEMRVYGVLGFGGTFPYSPLQSATWTNAAPRTFPTTSYGPIDTMTLLTADIQDFVSSSQRVGVDVGFPDSGGDLFGVRFIFADSPCLAFLAYWGINATTPA